MVVIPAFNEEAAIGDVITSAFRHADLPVWVVDDGSTDLTKERAQTAGARVLSLPFQIGAWGATQTGLRYAHKLGVDFVITMDAMATRPYVSNTLLETVVRERPMWRLALLRLAAAGCAESQKMMGRPQD